MTMSDEPDWGSTEEWNGKTTIDYFRGCGETLMAVMTQDQAEAAAAPKSKQGPSKRDLQNKDELNEKINSAPLPLRLLIKMGIPVIKFIFRRITAPKAPKKGKMSDEEKEFREGIIEL